MFSNSLNSLPKTIYIDNNEVIATDFTKFLGLYIDNKLSWKNYIDYLCKIVSKNIGIINRLKFYFPKHILLNLYNTLICLKLIMKSLLGEIRYRIC